MLYINKITNDASQSINLTGIPGLTIPMTLRYLPRIRAWMMGVTYGTIIINGKIMTTNYNLLRQYSNTLPFGICCITTNTLDPSDVNDFANQVANLYLLDSDDVAAIETGVFTGPNAP